MLEAVGFHLKSVPNQLDGNVPVGESVRSRSLREHVKRMDVEELAVNKYRSSGKGITIEDVIVKFSCNKQQAQRKLKHFHSYQDRLSNYHMYNILIANYDCGSYQCYR